MIEIIILNGCHLKGQDEQILEWLKRKNQAGADY